jgi:hypothetical protein
VPRSRARDLVRRSIGAVLVAGLLGGAVAVGAGLTVPDSAASPVAGAPAGVPVRTTTPTPMISPAATPSAAAAPGPATIAITARPEVDGSFSVTEVVTLPAPVTEAVLRPPDVGDAGTGFERLRPAAVEVEVRAGDQVIAVADGVVRDEVTVRWDVPSAELRLRYRLTQASVASAPARAGRRLAVFDSLLDRLPADLPVTAVVTGSTVLSLTCPQLPLAEMSCGAGIAPRFWTLDPIPFDRSRVQVQYDLPAPG